MNYRDLNPQIRAALVRWQHEADRQAERWVVEQIRARLHPQQRVTFHNFGKRPPLTHGAP